MKGLKEKRWKQIINIVNKSNKKNENGKETTRHTAYHRISINA